MSHRNHYGHKDDRKYAYDTYQKSNSTSNRHMPSDRAYDGRRESANESYGSHQQHHDSSRRESDLKRQSSARAYESERSHSYKSKEADNKYESAHRNQRPRRESSGDRSNRHGNGGDDGGDDDDETGGSYNWERESPKSDRHNPFSRDASGSQKSSHHHRLSHGHRHHGH